VRWSGRWSRDDVEGEVTKPRVGRTINRGSIPRRGQTVFPSPERPDRLSNPPSLTFRGYQELHPGDKASGA